MYKRSPRLDSVDADVVLVNSEPLAYQTFLELEPYLPTDLVKRLYKCFTASHWSCNQCGTHSSAHVNGEWLCADCGGDA